MECQPQISNEMAPSIEVLSFVRDILNPRSGSEESCARQQRPRVLVADDQPSVLHALHLLLKAAGYEVVLATGPEGVINALHSGRFELMLMDLNYTLDTTSGGEGLHLISRIHALDSNLPIIVMTAWATVGLAVEAMRRGACDFVEKPWSNAELLAKLRGVLNASQSAGHAQLNDREEHNERAEAAAIQRKLVSLELPQVNGCEISGDSRSLRFVGGDYCNVEELGKNRIAISIADVAGKGVPGALLGASLRSSEKSLNGARLNPAAVCASLNATMLEIMPEGRFVSFVYGVLDLERKRLTYCNAGHNPPLLVREDGSVVTLQAGGAVLGYFPEWNYQQEEIELRSGDRLVLFTDGVIEAGNTGNGDFGVERLSAIASEYRNRSAAELRGAIMQAVTAHCGGDFHDDATLLVVAIE
jgi:sigma-B regulation protein RsbU (phosphoserine phosphatase)